MTTNSPDQTFPTPSQLPPEFQAALKRAFSHSLDSLDSLRTSLHRHVHSERSRGVSFEQVDAQIHELLGLPDLKLDGVTNGEISAQVSKWTRIFFDGTKLEARRDWKS